MKITGYLMNKAVEADIISQEQSIQLIEFIKKETNQGPGFNLTNVLYYFGGLIAIGAMTLFMTLGWELYGGWGIVFLCVCYAMLSLALTHKLDGVGFVIPAGICATFVVCLTPLTIYGLQLAMGWWPGSLTYQDYHVYIKWHWVFLELGTLVVGVVLIWIYRYPFMVMPIALTLWYLSLDMASMLSGEGFNFEMDILISLIFGLVITLIAFWVDIRSRQSEDYAFWLYLIGVMIFWGAITSHRTMSELSGFIYLCLNLVMILIGVILSRKVFVIFGALGLCYYLAHLAFQVFQFSYFFPVALSAIGFGIIYLGLFWQRNEVRLTRGIRSILPTALQELFQARDTLE
ncbi:MAG: DUF2157 domain-containing protein [Legionella sp.]|nr:DUF2157 domain-containing protein [Legionella sp.]